MIGRMVSELHAVMTPSPLLIAILLNRIARGFRASRADAWPWWGSRAASSTPWPACQQGFRRAVITETVRRDRDRFPGN